MTGQDAGEEGEQASKQAKLCAGWHNFISVDYDGALHRDNVVVGTTFPHHCQKKVNRIN